MLGSFFIHAEIGRYEEDILMQGCIAGEKKETFPCFPVEGLFFR